MAIKDLTEDDLEELAGLFGQIATDANIVRELASMFAEDLESSAFFALEVVAEKIGYMADKGADKMGKMQAFGDADNWFL